MPSGTHHQVLIVGGGTAGITVAAILRRRARNLDIAIIEPAEEHYYQPSFTLVGAGVYPLAKTHRPEASVMPSGVAWVRGAAKTFEPEKNTVLWTGGEAVTYDYLVVCTGVKLDWDKIERSRRDARPQRRVQQLFAARPSTTPGNACRSSRPATRSCARNRRCRSSAPARRRRSSI